MADLELTGTRPPSVASMRPPSQASNRPKSGYHRVKETSDVDELLFASHHPRNEPVINFKPPWGNTPRNKQIDKGEKKSKMRPLLWTPDVGGTRGSVSSQSDRTHVLKSSNRGFPGTVDTERLNKYRPKKYQPSFCDETLFGPKLEEPSFEAPWAEKVKKSKPFMFSPIDYTKLTREDSSCSRYSESGTLDGRPPSRQGRRPKTANTRPVTVEACHDLEEKPTWKP